MDAPTGRTTIVIPCYNEARRLRLDVFAEFVQDRESTSFLFVDDGSQDETAALIADFCTRQPRCQLLRLTPNRGKAEAVRQGLLAACDLGTEYVGFWDADLATPLSEIPEFVAVLDRLPQIDWVFGSRIQMLGRSIKRRAARHYLGRLWATAVSLLLRLAVYDTQCGAKLFRVTDEFRNLLRDPFLTRWVFDVELIARLMQARRSMGARPVQESIYEITLRQWHDVAGSKLRARDFVTSGVELLRIYRHYSKDKEVDDHRDSASAAPPAPAQEYSAARH